MRHRLRDLENEPFSTHKTSGFFVGDNGYWNRCANNRTDLDTDKKGKVALSLTESETEEEIYRCTFLSPYIRALYIYIYMSCMGSIVGSIVMHVL